MIFLFSLKIKEFAIILHDVSDFDKYQKPKNHIMKLFEREFEDVFVVFYEHLIEKGLKLVGRQVRLENGLIVDVLFTDRQNRNVILELKRDAITKEDIGQSIQYAGLIENSRVILAAPLISKSVKRAFDHYGIEYLEFDKDKIFELFKKIPKTANKGNINDIKIPKQIFSEPLLSKIRDGNIAFKVTYVDKNWNGVCSDNLYDYNVENRVWCKYQSTFKESCRHKKYLNWDIIKMKTIPCYDSVASSELSFSPGFSRDSIVPYRCLDAKVKKIALFTSREPGELENERFIFAIGQIDFIDKPRLMDTKEETYYCENESAIRFDEKNYPKFWKYYKNLNAPDRIAWNTGLFRYISDNVLRNLLKDILQSSNYSNQIKRNARVLQDIL